MQTSISSVTRLSLLAERLHRFLNKWWAAYVLKPIIVVLPPGIVTAYAHDDSLARALDPVLPEFLKNFINTHHLLTYTFAVVYVYGLTALYAFIESRAKQRSQIDVPGLLALFNAFERIVGAKAKRFGQQVKKYGTAPVDGKRVFEDITQPDQQMALLAENLHAFLDAIDKTGTSFRVGIVTMEDSKPLEWLYFCPASEPPRTPIEDLRSPQSTICTCVRERQIVIVEDVRREAQKPRSKRRYVAGQDGNEEGSQICYPVHHPPTNTIPYVIAVAANRKAYFSVKKKELYVWIMRHFALRLELEHSLLILKRLGADK